MLACIPDTYMTTHELRAIRRSDEDRASDVPEVSPLYNGSSCKNVTTCPPQNRGRIIPVRVCPPLLENCSLAPPVMGMTCEGRAAGHLFVGGCIHMCHWAARKKNNPSPCDQGEGLGEWVRAPDLIPRAAPSADRRASLSGPGCSSRRARPSTTMRGRRRTSPHPAARCRVAASR